MKIIFHLMWLKKGAPARRGFKSPEALALVEEYVSRISKFVPCEIQGAPEETGKSGGVKTTWWCDRGPKARILSSEDVARQLERCAQESSRELRIFIGGPDGFAPEDEVSFSPSLRWSFGPMTLPHELAAVVAGEQVYRAWSILKGLPYHAGH